MKSRVLPAGPPATRFRTPPSRRRWYPAYWACCPRSPQRRRRPLRVTGVASSAGSALVRLNLLMKEPSMVGASLNAEHRRAPASQRARSFPWRAATLIGSYAPSRIRTCDLLLRSPPKGRDGRVGEGTAGRGFPAGADIPHAAAWLRSAAVGRSCVPVSYPGEAADARRRPPATRQQTGHSPQGPLVLPAPGELVGVGGLRLLVAESLNELPYVARAGLARRLGRRSSK